MNWNYYDKSDYFVDSKGVRLTSKPIEKALINMVLHVN